MALTASEVVEVAHYTGYAAAGAIGTAVTTALAGLTPEGEARIRSRFLPGLNTMEAGIVASVELVDTKQAAVFVRNEHELRERGAMFYWLRVSLARFLGLPPGPSCLITDLPPFSPCCPKGSTGSGGGTTTPIDPATGVSYTPAVFAV